MEKLNTFVVVTLLLAVTIVVVLLLCRLLLHLISSLMHSVETLLDSA